MKKIFLTIILICFLSIIFIPILVSATNCPKSGDPQATGLVPCGITCSCTIENFFLMIARVYDFLVKYVATTLAVIMITVGAVFMMISAGNPNLAGTGKKMVYSAIIGLVLVFGSWIIINALLELIGYAPPSGVPWYSLP